jgi:site-specific recombinase XerD
MGFTLSAGYADIYDEFLAYKKSRVSEQGYKTIEAQVRTLVKWFDEEDIPLEEAGIQDALRFRKAAGERTGRTGSAVSIGAVCNYLAAGRCFFDYLVQTERRETNPFMEVPYPRNPEHISRNVLTVAQMNLLLETLAKFDIMPDARHRAARYRVHVLGEFLYATGLRIAEASSLAPEDIDTERRLVHVRQGKGGIPRTAFLTGYAAEVMRLYLSEGKNMLESANAQGRNGTLFGSCHARMDIFLNRELRNICTALEIPVITSHGFRHSLGTHLLKAGCDMRHIQVILGHEKLGTTQIYTRVDKEDLKSSLDKFHPRKWQGVRKEGAE